jgi:hypothetical protein
MARRRTHPSRLVRLRDRTNDRRAKFYQEWLTGKLVRAGTVTNSIVFLNMDSRRLHGHAAEARWKLPAWCRCANFEAASGMATRPCFLQTLGNHSTSLASLSAYEGYQPYRPGFRTILGCSSCLTSSSEHRSFSGRSLHSPGRHPWQGQSRRSANSLS